MFEIIFVLKYMFYPMFGHFLEYMLLPNIEIISRIHFLTNIVKLFLKYILTNTWTCF